LFVAVVSWTTSANPHRLARYLQEAGFYKEREINLPHKQSNLFKINRDVWRAPAL
jgi:hypothetical protein